MKSNILGMETNMEQLLEKVTVALIYSIRFDFCFYSVIFFFRDESKWKEIEFDKNLHFLVVADNVCAVKERQC